MASDTIWDKLAKAETASSAQKGGGRKKVPTSTQKGNATEKKTVRHFVPDENLYTE